MRTRSRLRFSPSLGSLSLGSLSLGALLLFACGGPDAPDAGQDAGQDAGAGEDAGPVDASLGDGWRGHPPLPEAIQEITATVYQGEIWIAGGFSTTSGIVGTVRSLDPATERWTERPTLPAPRHHLSLVPLGEDLYAIGGMLDSSFTPLRSVYVLRGGGGGGADAWEEVAPLLEERAAHVAFAIEHEGGSEIVVVGGQDGRRMLAAQPQIYDPATDTWRLGSAEGFTPREHLGGFAYEGEIWAVAGRQNSLTTNRNEVEIYDPSADTWRPGPPIPTARGGFQMDLLGGLAFAVGGEERERALDSVEALDLATGTWRSFPPVPTPRHGHGVAALGGRLWVIGGADRPIFAAVNVVESYAP